MDMSEKSLHEGLFPVLEIVGWKGRVMLRRVFRVEQMVELVNGEKWVFVSEDEPGDFFFDFGDEV
jgi:hypothetical protein